MKKNLSSIPIWTGEKIIAKDILELGVELSYKFKNSNSKCRLVSEQFKPNNFSDQQKLFDEFGLTSYGALDLLGLDEWFPICKAIHGASCNLLSEEWIINGADFSDLWISIYPRNAYIPIHNHGDVPISGVLYLKSFEKCGDIIFQDPSWIVKQHWPFNTGTSFRFKPEDGDLYLFPGWLPHYTEPNRTDEDRIILSFNMVFPSPPKLRIQ